MQASKSKISSATIVIGVVLPLVLLVVGMGVGFGLQKPVPPKVPQIGEDKASLLSVMPAADVGRVHAMTDFSETLDIAVSGTVVPFREIGLAAEVAGKIVEKDETVRAGDIVSKGQLLLKIDPKDYLLEIERLERRRDQELATVKELEQDISNSESLLKVIVETLTLAEDEVKRFEKLGNDFASAAELDQAKRTRLNALNQRVNTENQIRSLKSRKTRLELAAKLAETELEQARINLERTEIVAPVDGRIVSEQVEVDSFVQRGTSLMMIEDTAKVEVSANLRMEQLFWVLDQADMSADRLVNAGQAANYDLPNIDVVVRYKLAGRDSLLYEWAGKLDRYDGSGLDPQSRTVPVRVVVDRPRQYTINGVEAEASRVSGPSGLVRGMFVEVVLKTQPATPLLLVPKLAIKPANNGSQVWKFDQSADQAYKLTLERNRKPDEEGEEPNKSTSGKLPADNNEETKIAEEESDKVEVKDWQPGLLQVVGGLQVVGPFNVSASEVPLELGQGVDYLVCESEVVVKDGVPSRGLMPGDYVVTTPLPGIQDGRPEPIRVAIDQINTTATPANEDSAARSN